MSQPPRGLSYAIVVLVAAAVHLQTLGFPFVFDDRYLVVLNAFLREAWSPIDAFAHHFWYGTPSGTAYYRPLVIASLALNGKLLGWGPVGFHLFNLLLHAANSALVLAVLLRIAVPKRAAVFGALLFAVHPATAWPVASIVARVDLLPAFFVLLAWLALVSGSPVATGLAFLGALLCKESAIAFLGVPFLALRAPLLPATGPRAPAPSGSGTRATASCALAALAAVAAAIALRLFAHVGLAIARSRIDGAVNPLAMMDGWERRRAALRLAGRYLGYLFVPWRFTDAAAYGPGKSGPSWGDPGVLFGTILLVLLAGLTVWLWLRRDRLSLFVGFMVAAFLPASNLLTPIGSLYAQNFLYMPLIGLALAAADARGRFASRTRVAGLAAAGVLLLFAAGTLVEARLWRSGPALFTAWTERFPNYGFSWAGLGTTRLDEGDAVGAEEDLRRSLTLDDRNAKAHYNLGVVIMMTTPPPELGGTEADAARLREGLEHSRRAAEIDPLMTEARINAARLLMLLDRPAEAETEARRALEATKGSAPTAGTMARRALAESIFKQHRYADALALYTGLLPATPDDPNLRAQYLDALFEVGDPASARREGERARADFPDLAWFILYSARVEARDGHADQARELLRTARTRDPKVDEWIGRYPELRGPSR
ncbi:MAG TPA: tetratricopeptide repeat protein [Verrucomicrobiae bacterium]|nr:tetratricopeptide repeat protein [Verrucomicrobiae bacterium]